MYWSRYRRLLEMRLRWARKWIWQRLHPAAGPARPVFVFGSGRSGTSMTIEVLDRSRYVWAYSEARRNAAFVDFRLRELDSIDRLIARCRAPAVAFKPIVDSHRADEILARYPGARALWPYRNYLNKARSSVGMWGAHHQEILRALAEDRRPAWLGWRAERISERTLELVKKAWDSSLDETECSILFWYVRNQQFFDMGLDRREDVLLLRYEDLATRPEEQFRRVFDFIGVPFEPASVEKVFASSARPVEGAEIRPEVRELAEEMMERLDRVYRASASSSEGAPP